MLSFRTGPHLIQGTLLLVTHYPKINAQETHFLTNFYLGIFRGYTY